MAVGYLLAGGFAWTLLWGQNKFDVCALLTAAEIEAVQDDQVTAIKASEPSRSGFVVSQCFYTAATFAKSVSLQVTRPDPKRVIGDGPRADWKRIFRQQQQRADKPLPVRGLGNEAFWVGDQVVGAIYVLEGDAYFRLSIGGWPEESVRMRKTRELALKVLERL
jgi:hypothetical protein